jgi:predicted permease
MRAHFPNLLQTARSLARTPGLASMAVLTLALGIGANTTIFSFFHTILLKPLPWPEADRLVQVWNTYPRINLPQATVSVPDYFDRREGVPAFEESALYFYESLNLAAEGPPERVIGARATASLFPLLRARAARGRAFTEAEDVPGEEKVVVLSHGLWKRAFGADPGIVGRDVRLDGEPHRVLGVMPPDFFFPNRQTDLWKPFAPTPEQRADDSRGFEFSSMIARLAPGATIEQAQGQVDAIHARNLERFPEGRDFWVRSGFGGSVVDLREDRYGELRPTLLLLQALVALVLLIACFNVASLLLADLTTRQKELAVRSALGAGLGRLAGQLLARSLLLAAAGGIVGLALAAAAIRLLVAFIPEDALGSLEVGLHAPALGFAAAAALATGLLVGLFPVVSLWRSDPGAILKEEGRGGGRPAARTRQALVVAEIAMALVLLAGAGLLIRTLAALLQEDPGFSRENVLLAQVALPESKYGEDHQVVAFFDDVLERVRAVPGVRAAGVISNAPFSGSSSSASYSIDGYTPGDGEGDPHALIRIADAGYFEALEIDLLAGRAFTAFDGPTGPPVMLVDRSMVDKYFPESSGRDPLAGRIRAGGDDSPPISIVGVVEPVKIRDLDRPITKETLYASYRQRPTRQMTFVLRAQGEPEALAEPLRRVVREVDPDQPIYGVTTLERQLDESLATRRLTMGLLVGFALLAVVLAAVGIYGVLAFSVEQRRREIGTRMALGAERRRVLALVLRQGLALSIVGVLVGTAAALAGSRAVASQLFGVRPWDPLTYAAVAAVLLAVTAIACWYPARRAAELEPMEALRLE